jgi:hypothetical protein
VVLICTVIIMATPSSVIETRAGIIDFNDFGNDAAWQNLSAPRHAEAAPSSSSAQGSFEPHVMSPALRALATDYHDSMAA